MESTIIVHPRGKNFMKNQFLLDIRKPCSEKWESFQSTAKGGLCNTCSTEVVDFTNLTDAEIATYFSKVTAKTCGRFRADQLKKYNTTVMPALRPGARLLRAGVVGLFVLLVSRPGMALPIPNETNTTWSYHSVADENKILAGDYLVKGVVKDEEGQPMAGANVYLKSDPTVGTTCDANGAFQFPRKLNEGDVIIFSFIGYEPKEYVVTKDVNETIELKLTMSFTVLLGDVSVESVYEKPSGLKKAWQKVKGIF